MELTLMEGNEAISWGAMAAGCNFFAGYPITPATTIYNTMLKLLPPQGGIFLQGEDEIASIGFCMGACDVGHENHDSHFRSGDQPLQRADFLCHRQRDPPCYCGCSTLGANPQDPPPKVQTGTSSFCNGATAVDSP